MPQVKVKVEALCVGVPAPGLVQEVERLNLDLEGIVGDRHRGFTKLADGRDTGIARGVAVRNWRQWSAVSVEELEVIANRLGIPEIDSAMLSANISFSGVENLTAIPSGSTIWFPSGTVLSVEGENEPCVGPGHVIAKRYSIEPHNFPKAAMHLRGLVGVVYRAGSIALHDLATIEVR